MQTNALTTSQTTSQTNSFSWLHLTDLHFGLKGQDSLWPNLRQPFLNDLEKLHQQTGPWQAVLFTGDLVQKGQSAEFAKMQKEVLERLWEKLAELGSGDAVLLAVPGNHDLYRPDATDDNPAVDALLRKDGFADIQAKFWDKPTGQYRTVVKNAFAAYEEWWHKTPKRALGLKDGILPGDFACTLPCGEQSIGIIGLNTAFLQLGDGDYRGRLVWDVRQLQAVCGDAMDWVNKHDVCLLLTHQGPDWLTEEAKTHGTVEIAPAGRFAVHLFGHMHETNICYTRSGGNPDAVRLLQSCSIFGMEKYGNPPTLMRSHGYTAGKISFVNGQANLRIWPRIATNKTGGWRFIPDHENAHLQGDEGTAAENIACHSKKSPIITPRNNPSAQVPSVPTNPHAPQAPRSTLPSRRSFFGRQKELADIARFLHPDFKGWGVVIDGPGGMGKTALALEAAHAAPTEHFPLKVFVSAKQTRLDPDGEHRLQDNRADDYFALLSQIGLALGCSEMERTPAEKRADVVRHALAGQKALLVLDNLEFFSPQERRRVYDLLEMLPNGCRAIVTSRRRDETAARTLRLDKIDFDSAQKLLAELGERAPAVAKLSATEQQTLYEETGGNPLLLTWVAAQLGCSQGRCHSVADAVARLHEAHNQHGPKNDPLEFVFGDLLDTFTETETAMLAALAHFSIPARLDWLLPLANVSKTAAQTALDDLRNRALLIDDDANETWFLPALCGHFLRLRRPEAIQASGERLANQAYALVYQYGSSENAPFLELEAAWPQIEAALPLLIAGDNARLQQVCDGLNKFLQYSGLWNIRLVLSTEAEAKALVNMDKYNAGWRSFQAGYIHALQGNAAAVMAAAERCTNHWQGNGITVNQHTSVIKLRGLGHEIMNNHAEAITAYTEALNLFRVNSNKNEGVALRLNDLGGAKLAANDLDGAEAHFREALHIATKAGNREGIVMYTANLANVAIERKNWASAEELATKTLELSEKVGRLELIGGNHHLLAKALEKQQRTREAIPHAREAVAIFTRLHSPRLAAAAETLAACEQALTNPPE